MAGDQGDGILEVTVPVKAGSRTVGATFLATNFRPSLDLIKQYDRKSLENNSIPQLQYYPAIGFLRISGPFNAQRPGGLAQPPQGVHLPAGDRRPGRAVRAADPDDAGAARVPAAGHGAATSRR